MLIITTCQGYSQVKLLPCRRAIVDSNTGVRGRFALINALEASAHQTKLGKLLLSSHTVNATNSTVMIDLSNYGQVAVNTV